jgi:hypothetical protein
MVSNTDSSYLADEEEFSDILGSGMIPPPTPVPKRKAGNPNWKKGVKKVGPIQRAIAPPLSADSPIEVVSSTIKKSKRSKRAETAQVLKELKLVKDVFAETFMDLQYMDKFSLKTWAMSNPTEFYRLAAKLIPVQLTGAGGGAIELANVTFE